MRLAFAVKEPVRKEWKSISTLFAFVRCEKNEKKRKEKSISNKKDAKNFKMREVANMLKKARFLPK